LPTLLEEKNIMFALRQDSIQKIFSANGYGGEVHETRDTSQQGIYDFLSINEANIGANKSNKYVTRKITYETTIGEREIESKVRIDLQNSGQETQDYKVYIRVVVPLRSVLQDIAVDGVMQRRVPAVADPRDFERRGFRPNGFEFDTQNQDGKTVFSFVTTVAKSKSQTIELRYSNGARPIVSSLVPYSLLYSKQPGTGPYPLSIAVNHEGGFVPENSADLISENGAALFQDTITRDVVFDVDFVDRN
jgi:hypothetical protein